MKKLIKEYILKLLEYQEIKLKCVNLGWSKDKEIEIELSLIDMAKKEIKEKLP